MITNVRYLVIDERAVSRKSTAGQLSVKGPWAPGTELLLLSFLFALSQSTVLVCQLEQHFVICRLYLC